MQKIDPFIGTDDGRMIVVLRAEITFAMRAQPSKSLHYTPPTVAEQDGVQRFSKALNCHHERSLKFLDLKDLVIGKHIVDLAEYEALQARELIQDHEH